MARDVNKNEFSELIRRIEGDGLIDIDLYYFSFLARLIYQ